ncbi:MAG: FGGY family carbohydrate kinase, partial [Hungatella sp.]
MNKTYVIGIDQSTQGTKALLFDEEGRLLAREDLPHRQIVNERGWVEHDPEEIYQNTIAVVKNLIEHQAVSKSSIAGIGISNQRETALAWERESGIPIYNAIVWQCARGEDICKEIKAEGYDNMIREHTGLPLSPYFSAAKLSWIMRRVAGAQDKNRLGKLCCGTMDSWLIYRLTGKKEFKTDYSNASRTQLFNLTTLSWDAKLCQIFGINPDCLARVCDSDAKYGMTDLEGYLPEAVPIHGVLGDSHGALFGQGCIHKGMIKTTYGTGSSVMMNVGEKPVFSSHGAASSLAWC